MFRNNKIYLQINNLKNVFEYTITDLKQYPNVPFYSLLFDNEEIIKSFKAFVHSTIKTSTTFSSRFSKPLVFLLIPDDIMNIEKRALFDFATVVFTAKSIFLANECAFVIQEKIDYITISKSCRMTTISYLKDKGIAAQKFIENKDYTVDDLKRFITNLHEDCTFNRPLVYLNGLDLKHYIELGTVVDDATLLKNFNSMLSTIIIKGSTIITKPQRNA
ncbi:hypothetical protein [Clostridium sp.]|uniref:hypothetical protein n=1 Tax=Clostridium sp. TaxID=1506 RepID=UPI00321715AE